MYSMSYFQQRLFKKIWFWKISCYFQKKLPEQNRYLIYIFGVYLFLRYTQKKKIFVHTGYKSKIYSCVILLPLEIFYVKFSRVLIFLVTLIDQSCNLLKLCIYVVFLKKVCFFIRVIDDLKIKHFH